MNIVDLVVSRSGAMTITEIANVGVPAIFIPFPFATENHQEYNAKVLKNVGAAKIILDKNLTAEELNSTISNLVKDKKSFKRNGRKSSYSCNTRCRRKNLQRNQRSCLKTTPYNLLIKGEFKWQTS